MPYTALERSVRVFWCCNDLNGCNAGGVLESVEDTERVVLSLSVKGDSRSEGGSTIRLIEFYSAKKISTAVVIIVHPHFRHAI